MCPSKVRQTYFCKKCKCLHCYGGKIYTKHRKFMSTNEAPLW